MIVGYAGGPTWGIVAEVRHGSVLLVPIHYQGYWLHVDEAIKEGIMML